MPHASAVCDGSPNSASAPHYAGDLMPKAAWEMLEARESAVLVDVRTLPEWQFIGLPNLATLGKKPVCLSWKFYPTFESNKEFVNQLLRDVPDVNAPVLFLCRSGGRSLDAAIAATQAGYAQAYNIAGGFEGEADASGHRGGVSGWKADALPWEQN